MAFGRKVLDATFESKPMRDLFSLSLIASTIRVATPLVLAALGGLFSERSGVINIALEGKMLAGAFTAAAVTYAADTRLGMGAASPWAGLLAGMIAGLFIAAIYAVSCIRFKADQVVSGAAINILMLGIPGFLGWRFVSLLRIDSANSKGPSVAAVAMAYCYRDTRARGWNLVRALQDTFWIATAIGRRES